MTARLPYFGSGGGGDNSSTDQTFHEAGDSLISNQLAEVVYLVGVGPIYGWVHSALRDTYLNGTPVQNPDGTLNFSNVSIDAVWGEKDQLLAAGFANPTNEIGLGLEVRQPAPLVRSVTNPLINAVRVTLSTPVMTEQDSGSNTLRGSAVEFAIDVDTNGGGFAEVLRDSIIGKTTTSYQRAYRIPLTGQGPWRVRVRRITPDSASALINNKLMWASFAQIIEQRMVYPHAALIRVRFSAKEFSSAPTVTFRLRHRLVLVPRNYTPGYRKDDGTYVAAVYATTGPGTTGGVWDGTFKEAWCDCPPWHFYDMVTNRLFGFAVYAGPQAEPDKFALYEAAKFCDELVPDGFGGLEPRFSCNLYLQTQQEAWKLLAQMAGIFRAMTFWSADGTVVSVDRPQDPVQDFAPANVIDGKFTYSGSARSTRHSVATVAWSNQDEFGAIDYEVVTDDEQLERFGHRETQLVAIGCTSRAQAYRFGLYTLLANKVAGEIVSQRTAFDTLALEPGRIFRNADPKRSGKRLGGRVRGATVDGITLDAPVTLEPGTSYTVTFGMPDGTRLSRGVVWSGVVETAVTALEFVTDAPTAPLLNSVWVLSSGGDDLELWRAISVKDLGKGQVEITGVAHRPEIFPAIDAGKGFADAVPRRYKVTATRILDLSVTESADWLPDNTYTPKLVVAWRSGKRAASYSARWRVGASNWTDVQTFTPTFDILAPEAGTYEIEVFALSVTKRAGPTASTSYDFDGTIAIPAPGPVLALSASVKPFGLEVRWGVGTGSGISRYLVRMDGASWDVATEVADVSGTMATLSLPGEGTHVVRVRALNIFGQLGAEASTSVLVDYADVSGLTFSLSGPDILIDWDGIAGNFAIDYYEVRHGMAYAGSELITKSYTDSWNARVNWGGLRRFWVRAFDVAGNPGAVQSVDVLVRLPASVTPTVEIIDNNLLFRWPDAATTLPVEAYELRKGASWGSGTLVGDNGNGLFAAYFETVAGTYDYWLQARDSAGNLSTPTKITAKVSQPPGYLLQGDYNSTFSGTRVNVVLEDGVMSLPWASETVQQHFESRGWATVQDQINAGYPFYLQPSASSASYEEVIDYLAPLPLTKIQATLSSTLVRGAVTITPTISYRATTGDAWTNAAGVSEVFAAGFRYVKVRYDFAASGGDDLLEVTGLNVKLSSKEISESLLATVSASDVGGTTVPLTVAFYAIKSAQGTYKGTDGRYVVVDWDEGTPYPTSVKVFLFNTSTGARASGDVSIKVDGV